MNLVIVKMPWNQAASDLLAPTMADDPLSGVASIGRDVERGVSELFGCFLEDQLVLAYVLRIEQHMFGTEGVIVLASGNVPGVSLTDTVLPFVERQLSACDGIRIHTNRPGLVKILTERFGYSRGETVLRKIRHG